MKRKFRSYKELLQHKQKLKALIEANKDLMRRDIELLKIDTKPASDFFGKLKRSERKQRLLAIGLGFVAKTVFEKIILMRVGWAIRLIAPYFAENSRFDLKTVMNRFKNRISSVLKKIAKETNEVTTNIKK